MKAGECYFFWCPYNYEEVGVVKVHCSGLTNSEIRKLIKCTEEPPSSLTPGNPCNDTIPGARASVKMLSAL